MNSRNPTTGAERLLRLAVRVVGGVALVAVGCVVMPGGWMDAIHQWLGMGELPGEPVVGYLARSVSAFYALFGGLLWVVSFDLRRHRLVLDYLGVAITLFGLALLGVDIIEGMPLWWVLAEGPFNIAFGILVLVLNRRGHPVSGNC